jgi:SnoaL-like protein
MSNVTQAIDNYIAAWNERDAKRRKEIIARTWSEDGSYIDPHRGGTGYDQLSAMIQTVHDAFPPEYRFRLASRVDEYGDRVRFQWEAGGTKDAPLHFVGTDFAVVDGDGRFKSVTGFVDEAPAPAAVKAAS